jgi:uncharacterized Zn finger protein/DNA-binding transcriptional regulator YiaG
MAYGWKPYVPVAKRRARAEREMKRLAKQGQRIEPVQIAGRSIAHSFWGQAWCEHLESFSDYANRLPRGRTYVRNGSVCHLRIGTGQIEAIVSGSELYQIRIDIDPLPKSHWQRLRDQCTGRIGSALELLQGRLSKEVMAIVTHREQGLFPKPGEIRMHCSCPDWADLCKHLAAVLYGVGARLDQQPELLFQLRGVDPQALIGADLDLTRTAQGSGRHRRLDSDDLAGLFGVAIDEEPAPVTTASTTPKRPRPAPRHAAAAASAPDSFSPTGPAIAELRRRLDLNKTELAHLVGVTPTTIANWEKQAGTLKLQRVPLAALRRVLAMTPQHVAQALDRNKRPRGR